MYMNTKKNKTTNNSTKKNRRTSKQLEIYCKQHANTFNSFEKEYEKKVNVNTKEHETYIKKKLTNLFNTPFTPSKFTPKNDYYTYINYSWITNKSKELKAKAKHYVQIDSFRMVQEKVYYELIDIIKEYIKNNDSPKTNAIKNVYNSLHNLDNKSAEKYIEYYLQLTNTRIASGNLYRILGGQNTNEIISWASPIVWNVLRDEQNIKYYKSTISAPKLALYDYVLYIENPADSPFTKKYKANVKREYLKFISTMFNLVLGKNHGLKAMDVWDCEYNILTALGCDSVKNDNLGYNILTHEEGLKYGFDWNEYATQIGYKNVPKTFICTSLNYLKCMMELLQTNDAWQSLKWKTYYYYINFKQIIRFHSKWRILYYNFHGKFIKGQPIPYPRELYPVFGMSFCFNTFLTNEYINKNKDQRYIDYTHNMASDLLTVYKRIIRRNTWMSPSTKKYALLKLEHIKLDVGSPKILREDPVLNYDNKEAYQNMLKLAHWRSKKFIDLDGTSSDTDIPVIDWEEFKMVGKQSYIVNAYYTPTENAIYVPLAYLQKPFIDLEERGIEYNLAFIGYTLAHEMSHCLDNSGSKYDEKGNLHNWWTEQDLKKFNLKIKNVIKQYETFASYDGIKMDATLSTGENLADISGLAICQEYLQDFQQNNNDIGPIQALSFEAFFTYIAIQSRQKIFDKAINAQLKINPHPLDKYRTNCPLARLELFRSLYNIKKGDKMYWDSTDTIW